MGICLKYFEVVINGFLGPLNCKNNLAEVKFETKKVENRRIKDV